MIVESSLLPWYIGHSFLFIKGLLIFDPISDEKKLLLMLHAMQTVNNDNWFLYLLNKYPDTLL